MKFDSKFILRKQVLLYAAAFFCASAWCFSLQGAQKAEIKILKDGKEQREHLLRNYLKTVNRCCTGALKGVKKADFDIVGIISPEKKKMEISRESRNELKIFFPEKFADDNEFHDATREIIREILSRKIAISLKNENGRYLIPEWIISGIQSRAYSIGSGKKAGIGITLTGAYSIAVTNSIPPLKKIIENPLLPSDGAPWELYAELCRILVEHVSSMNPKESAIRQIIKLDTKQNAPYPSFVTILKGLVVSNIFAYKFSDSDIDEKNAGEDEQMQLWFRYAVMKKAINVFNPAPSGFSSALLDKAMTVKVEVALDEKKTKTEVCKIAEIPELAKFADLRYFIAIQEKYIAEIMYFSNAELHPSLRKIMKSYDLLEKGDKAVFLKELETSMAEFRASADRVGKIEEYLSAMENNSGTPGVMFNPWKTPQERYNIRNRQIWKDLDSYLEGKK